MGVVDDQGQRPAAGGVGQGCCRPAEQVGPVPESVPSIDEAFITAVKSGDRSPILCDYREGVKSAAACIAPNESAATGRPVTPWIG